MHWEVLYNFTETELLKLKQVAKQMLKWVN